MRRNEMVRLESSIGRPNHECARRSCSLIIIILI